MAAAASVPPAIAESSEPASLTSTYEPPSLEPLALSASIEVAKPHARCVRQPSTGSGLDVAEVVVCVEEEDPNDSGIESNGSNGHPRLERGVSTSSDVFDQEESQVELRRIDTKPRTRQISTSLVKDPVMDDNLKDFHNHHLEDGKDALEDHENHEGVHDAGKRRLDSLDDRPQGLEALEEAENAEGTEEAEVRDARDAGHGE